MKKLYQKEWHGIPFESFTTLSSTKIADTSFYKSFYDIFFKIYRDQSELDPLWIKLKLQTAQFLMDHSKFKKTSKILSIGCGLGIIEKAIINNGYVNLEITEVFPEPLKWLRPHISENNIHIGFIPTCLADNRFYDFIYLSSVEYFFKQEQLIDFLKAIINHLVPGGICLIISWSFNSKKIIQRSFGKIKDLAKFVLEKTGIRNRGQLWGYIRNRKDFHDAMINAGLIQIKDGFLEKKTHWDTYWIEGSRD